MMRFHISRWAALALAATALVASAAGAGAAPAIDEFAIRYLPDSAPAAYLRVQGKDLRVAPTREALDSVQPVKAQHSESYRGGPNEMTQTYTFPQVELPVTTPGVTAKATLRYQRTVRSGAAAKARQPGASLYGEFRLSREDSAGAAWTYVTSTGVEGGSGKGTNPPAIDLPDVSKLALTVETQVEGRTAGIGLRVKSGNAQVGNVLKNDKAVSARIEVVDKDGNAVHSQRGNLEKFGFG